MATGSLQLRREKGRQLLWALRALLQILRQHLHAQTFETETRKFAPMAVKKASSTRLDLFNPIGLTIHSSFGHVVRANGNPRKATSKRKQTQKKQST